MRLGVVLDWWLWCALVVCEGRSSVRKKKRKEKMEGGHDALYTRGGALECSCLH